MLLAISKLASMLMQWWILLPMMEIVAGEKREDLVVVGTPVTAVNVKQSAKRKVHFVNS